MQNTLIKRFHETFATLAAAARAAGAVDVGRKPKSEDLKTLGIEPAAFRHIGR